MGIWGRRERGEEERVGRVRSVLAARRELGEPDPIREGLAQHIVGQAFRARYTEGAEMVEITEGDIRSAARVLIRGIRKFPVRLSRMRTVPPVPRFLLDRGFSRIDLVERGVYRLTRERETLDLAATPCDADRILVATKVPSLVSRHLGWDGPSVMSALVHARALEEFFGHPCFFLQPYPGVTGTPGESGGANYFFLLEEGGKDVSVPVTVAVENARWLSPNRIRSGVRVAADRYPELPIRPVSVTVDEERRILVTEYRWRETETRDLEIEGLRSRRYRFEPQLLAWRR